MTLVAMPRSDLPDPLAPARAALPHLAGLVAQPLAGGRSNRLWRLGETVVKLYDLGAARPLFPNDPQAEVTALRALAGSSLAPDLLHMGEGWIAYRFCPGATWQRDPRPVAQALARLHRRAAPTGLRALPMGAAAIAAHAQSFAPVGLPPLPAFAEAVPAQPRLVHGDAVPGNMIATSATLTLIDWQCPGAGDPVDDLALFLSPAMQQLYRGAPLTADETAAFLAAYPDPVVIARYHALRPLLHWRIAAHCALRAAEGDADYAAALKLECAAL